MTGVGWQFEEESEAAGLGMSELSYGKMCMRKAEVMRQERGQWQVSTADDIFLWLL